MKPSARGKTEAARKGGLVKASQSPAKAEALDRAHKARRTSAAAAREALRVPEGFRSLDHFLDSVSDSAGRIYGGQRDLARYLSAPTKSVSRWLSRQQCPRQDTIDAMHTWYLTHRPPPTSDLRPLISDL